MQRYGGTLVHCSRDAEGFIEVVDQFGLRSLHFGNPTLQSRMRLADPAALMVDYTRAMLAPLLFIDSPATVLILGLGGGSLARFMLYHFPRCRVQVVERRAAVVEVAYAYFLLPRDPRLAVYTGDAGDYLRSVAGAYDLILVDLFDAAGPAAALAGEFFARCRQRLAQGGAASINLWQDDPAALHADLLRLREAFPEQVLDLPVAGKNNYVAVAFRDGPVRPPPRLRRRAHALSAALGIEFPRLLSDLQRHNKSLC